MRSITWQTACQFAALIMLLTFIAGCGNTAIPVAITSTSLNQSSPSENSKEQKIGVLLISHGSHSAQWRKMLLSIEGQVRDEVLADGQVAGLKSAFMEYTEPTIARRLKEFDEQGYTDVIIVPILLTVSSHSFDDIPVIAGQKEDHQTLENLKLEGIEVFKPKAKITIAPLLNFPDVLEKNVARRVLEQSKQPAKEGIVMVAYGSEPYDEEWKELLEGVSEKVQKQTGVDASEYCWCGHIVRYSQKPTEEAIRKILDRKETAIVIPVLVAVDEGFQGKIIGGAIKNMKLDHRIRYRHDAILPDDNINQWIVEISHKLASELRSEAVPRADTP